MIKEIGNKEFENEVLQSSNLCIVDFFATWCPPCKMLSPEIEAVSGMYTDANFYKINTDDNVELSMKYKISVVPTVMFFKNGNVINTEEGFKTKEELKKIIDDINDKPCRVGS